MNAQEIHEDCCKAQGERRHESPEPAAVTAQSLRVLASYQACYEALLLPLTYSPERPRPALLFYQCLHALSASKVCLQYPKPNDAWLDCPRSVVNLKASNALLSSFLLALLAWSEQGEISRDLPADCGSFDAWCDRICVTDQRFLKPCMHVSGCKEGRAGAAAGA